MRIYQLGRSTGAREGVAALLERRPPSFRMRSSTDMPGFHEHRRAAGNVTALGGPVDVRRK